MASVGSPFFPHTHTHTIPEPTHTHQSQATHTAHTDVARSSALAITKTVRQREMATQAPPKRPKPAPEALPKILFGTSSLGNLFSEPTHEEKKAVVKEVLGAMTTPLFDSAGKYGAGLALEELGKCLEELGVSPDKVLISNKLAWKRVPLTTPEPTFEPGAWVNLKNDAVQSISYAGILECYEQGNELLGKYEAQIVSVHDPDEYLSSAKDDADLAARKADVLGAYKALSELKAAGKVKSIGVGAKDISVIDFITDHVQLDWAMFACSITPFTHTLYARQLLGKLRRQGVGDQSAIFNAGFLIGATTLVPQKVTRERRKGSQRIASTSSAPSTSSTAHLVQFDPPDRRGLHAAEPRQTNVELSGRPPPFCQAWRGLSWHATAPPCAFKFVEAHHARNRVG